MNAPQPRQIAIAAMTSLGRCQAATIVPTPVRVIAAVPAKAAGPRPMAGATSSNASTNDVTTVVCPLGRLLEVQCP